MGTRAVSHLLLLRLPGNVERIVNLVRNTLFEATGAMSTQALPPVLALAYLGDAPPAEAANLLPQTEVPPISLGGVVASDSSVTIEIEWPAQFRALAASLTPGKAPPSLPAPFSGVFLGSTDLANAWKNLDDRSRDEANEAVADMTARVSVFSLELHSIETSDDAQWWRNVDWEVMWSRRIKLRG